MCCGELSGRTLSFQWAAWLQGWTSQGYSKTGRNVVDIFHPISESIEREHILMVIDKTLWIPRERNKNKSFETLQVLQVRHEKIHSCDSFFFATSIHIYFFVHIYLHRNTEACSLLILLRRRKKTFLTYLVNSINAFDDSLTIHFAVVFWNFQNFGWSDGVMFW